MELDRDDTGAGEGAGEGRGRGGAEGGWGGIDTDTMFIVIFTTKRAAKALVVGR